MSDTGIGMTPGQHAKLFEREGPDLWNVFESDVAPSDPNAGVIELLRTAAELDRLGDILAVWAVDRAGTLPNVEVDGVIADVSRRLDALGVPREERTSPPRQRGV